MSAAASSPLPSAAARSRSSASRRRRAAADPVLSHDDWRAIQRVIGDQLDALRAGDAERAFGFAAAGIRAQVGDAATFMAMVRSGYEALLVARYTEFLEGAVIDGRRDPAAAAGRARQHRARRALHDAEATARRGASPAA